MPPTDPKNPPKIVTRDRSIDDARPRPAPDRGQNLIECPQCGFGLANRCMARCLQCGYYEPCGSEPS